MKYTINNNIRASQINSDCLIIAIYQDQQYSIAAKDIDASANNAISDFLSLGDFTGKLAETATLYSLPHIAAKRIILVGCGEKASFSGKAIEKATLAAAKALNTASNCTSASSYLLDEVQDIPTALQQSVIQQATATYQCNQYKSQTENKIALTDFSFAFTHSVSTPEQTALQYGQAIAKGMQLAKDLANAPGNICTPSYLASSADELCQQYDSLNLEVLEESDMQTLGMGSFLSVSQGSEQAGKMIVMQYQGTDADTAPFALVGKGITFDTGGISLKPGAAMDEMKYDMGGAASVLGTIQACAEMGLAINVVAVIAAAENMPSSKASKPGDIVTSMSGQTIEILNTDAEGRLVLCDALTYVDKYQPDAIVDIATLTGACIVALGHHISGLMSNDNALADEILQAGKDSADEAWRLPMTEDYQNQLKSNFADIPNIGNDRSAGTITAACFLSRFVEGKKWAHLDIAGTAWKSGAAKGATGRPVPLLSQILINRAQS
jgi:leucyl aminopeptidase